MPDDFDSTVDAPEVEYVIEGDPGFDPEAGDQSDVDTNYGDAESDTPVAQAPAVDQTLLNRIAAMERQNGALELMLQRLLPQHGQPAPKPIDPNNIQTVEDLIAYNKQLMQDHEQGIQTAAQRATREAHARGMFSAKDLGPGNDFDSLIAKHITPITQVRPQLKQLLDAQDDPASASFFLAIFHELNSRMGGDPVKLAKTLLGSMQARSSGAKDVLKAVDNGARKAARNITRPGGGGSPSRQKLSAQAITDMSDEDFKKLDRQVSSRYR